LSATGMVGRNDMNAPNRQVNRREFLQQGAMIAGGTAAVSSTALSYDRILLDLGPLMAV
jgi:hypothetical protein